MKEVIQIHNLCKSFGKKIALDHVELELEKGKIIGILGENGAGKTTLIKILAGLYRKDSGEVKIEGKQVGFDTHKYISYMPDDVSIYSWMKVKQAISFYKDMYSDFKEEKAHQLCTELQIKQEDVIQNLSKGMIERVFIMLTLSRDTSIYLLDDPIGGIDPVAKEKILKTILANTEEDRTVIISTHLVKDTEKLFDEVIFIRDGKVVIQKSSDEIRQNKGKSIEEYYLEVMEND